MYPHPVARTPCAKKGMVPDNALASLTTPEILTKDADRNAWLTLIVHLSKRVCHLNAVTLAPVYAHQMPNAQPLIISPPAPVNLDIPVTHSRIVPFPVSSSL